MNPAQLDGIQGEGEHSAFLSAPEDLPYVNSEHCILLLVLRQLFQDQNATRCMAWAAPTSKAETDFCLQAELSHLPSWPCMYYFECNVFLNCFAILKMQGRAELNIICGIPWFAKDL